MRPVCEIFRFLVSGLLLAAFSGCGGGETPSKPLPTTVPATGTVLLDGKPLSLATVLFVPSGATKGIECVGYTDENGKFSLEQLRGAAGAPPGEYRVVVSRYLKNGQPVKLGPEEFPANVGAVESMPLKYSSPTESILVATVPPSGGEIPVELKSR